MISESPFAAVFGAAVPGGEDSLVHVARYAIRMGYAVVPCLPGTKKPLCTLPSTAVKKADVAAQEEARAAGRRRWELVRHTCGVHHAMTDEKESDRVIRRLVKQYEPNPINIGIELGRSRVIVVDVDTDSERLGFEASWREATDGAMPPMTVLSPGVQDGPGGEWLHKNGGHYWFTLPDGWELPASDGAMKDESGWIAMWANRQVLVPPSIRREGPYQLVGDPTPAPVWLLKRILDHLDERLQRATAQEARRQERSESDSEAHIDGWSTATSWASLLEADGWYATTLPDNCGCEIWTAPGVHASPKSATAHDIGCALYDDSPGHAPLHVWTDNPPEFLVGENKTLTKIQYVALRDHGGNMPAACRAEGISREGGAELIPLPGVPPHLGGPISTAQFTGPVDSDTQYYEQGGADETAALNSGTPGSLRDAIEAAAAAGRHDEAAELMELEDAEIEAGMAAETREIRARVRAESVGGLTPLPAPSENRSTAGPGPVRDHEVPPPPPIGELPAGPVVPPKEDEYERLVRLKLQELVIRAEADKRHTEIRFPYAAKLATRGFEPMREVLKAAAATPAEFLIERWLRKGSYGVLGAEYKAGKTFIFLDMALSIATGTKFLGTVPCALGRVAMMHNEGDKVEFAERLRAVAASKRIELTDLVLDRLMFQEGASKLDQPEAINKLHADLEAFSPDLIGIDPWYMSAGDDADGKTLSKMGTVLGNLQGVAQDLGSALLITAHWNKSGDGKGVSRWSGSGLAEWGRVLINVAVDKSVPSAPYSEDKTGKTSVDLTVSLAGQVTGNYWVHREVWRDDAADLSSTMRYLVTAREQEDIDADNASAARDVSRTPRERLLRAFAACAEGYTKTKALVTAKGAKGGRDVKSWQEAFDELVRDDLIADVGELLLTNADGQIKKTTGVKYGITKEGRAEIERFDEQRKNAGADTRRFTALTPLATTEDDHA